MVIVRSTWSSEVQHPRGSCWSGWGIQWLLATWQVQGQNLLRIWDKTWIWWPCCLSERSSPVVASPGRKGLNLWNKTNYNNEINKRTDGFASHPSFYFWALPADSGEAFCFRPSIRCRDWQSETFRSDDSATDRRPDWLELAGCGAFQAHYINIHRRCVLTEFRYSSKT